VVICLYYTGIVFVTQELCLLHRNCVCYTGTVFVTQELCLLHRNCVCYTGTMFFYVRIKLLVIFLGPLILFLEQRQFVLYVATYTAVSLYY
jgi:hypothetical protein